MSAEWKQCQDRSPSPNDPLHQQCQLDDGHYGEHSRLPEPARARRAALMEQASHPMTTPDDKLAALMELVEVTSGNTSYRDLDGQIAAVRAAAVAYGRAVAIAELEAMKCCWHKRSVTMNSRCPLADRIAELRSGVVK